MIWTVNVLAITLLVAPPAARAQAPARAPLDPAVVKAVDPLYPGFMEILERDDADGEIRLARTLADHPSPDSLAVLLWMLRYCPSWPSDEGWPLYGAIRAVGRLPLGPVADTLLHAGPHQRLSAANLLLELGRFIAANEQPRLDEALVSALQDPSDRVRDKAVAALRARKSETAARALREYLAIQETVSAPRPQPPGPISFPPATVTLLASIGPDYPTRLPTLSGEEMWKLLAALRQSSNAADTPVLMWLLVNGHTNYGPYVISQLSFLNPARELPFGELANMLRTAEPERRALIAELFSKLFNYRRQAISPGDRDRVIAALIECLDASYVAVRNQAVDALGYMRAVEAIDPIVRLAEGPDGELYQDSAIRALGTIATSDTLPALERLARAGASRTIRERAATACIRVSKPFDPAAQARYLLWEQPDTALEKRVLVEGKTALPAVQHALTEGAPEERRAAAALLGWFRDTSSIGPILRALDAAPGALTREQLLFDLNMILLTEAPEADRDDRNALAALHLQWLYDELTTPSEYGDTRSAVLTQKTIEVFPDRVAAPLSVTVGGSSTARRSASADAFLDAVRKTGWGVAFHPITVANGVARVASTVYLPQGRIANQARISLYRKDGDRWVPLRMPSPVRKEAPNESSLLPTVERNYGSDHPLKILRLDLAMERIRVDLKSRDVLFAVNRDHPAGWTTLNASYLPLLERYTRSDSSFVRYATEFETARLTKQPNLDTWIAALAPQSGTTLQNMAVEALTMYLPLKVAKEGRELSGKERADLVAAARRPVATVDPRFVPSPLPAARNISEVRQWTRFGLVDVSYGFGGEGQRGYSMLFERRDDRWIFLCAVLGWVS